MFSTFVNSANKENITTKTLPKTYFQTTTISPNMFEFEYKNEMDKRNEDQRYNDAMTNYIKNNDYNKFHENMYFGDYDINGLDSCNNTPLITACIYKRTQIALSLLSHPNTNVSILRASYNKSALTYACENKLNEIALLIIEKLNESCDEHNTLHQIDCFGRSPLSYACMNNMRDVAVRLLENVPSDVLEKCDDREYLPIDYAEKHNIHDIFDNVGCILK